MRIPEGRVFYTEEIECAKACCVRGIAGRPVSLEWRGEECGRTFSQRDSGA